MVALKIHTQTREVQLMRPDHIVDEEFNSGMVSGEGSGRSLDDLIRASKFSPAKRRQMMRNMGIRLVDEALDMSPDTSVKRLTLEKIRQLAADNTFFQLS